MEWGRTTSSDVIGAFGNQSARTLILPWKMLKAVTRFTCWRCRVWIFKEILMSPHCPVARVWGCRLSWAIKYPLPSTNPPLVMFRARQRQNGVHLSYLPQRLIICFFRGLGVFVLLWLICKKLEATHNKQQIFSLHAAYSKATLLLKSLVEFPCPFLGSGNFGKFR